jgi:uncharacterized protein (TIGR03118 family)
MKRKLAFFFVVAGVAALLLAAPKRDVYLEHGLVSDLPPHAEHRDRNLVNPWGISFSPTSPFWISDNGTGLVTVYDGNGNPAPAASPIIVTVPPAGGGTPPSAPTGQVFNSTSGFLLDGVNKALFLFATEDGTISEWNPMVDATNAKLKVDNSASGTVYKGLAIGATGFLYAADFHGRKIDWFNPDFSPVVNPTAFLDATIPLDFAPFNIQNLGGLLYVTYAKQDADKKDDVPGAGLGYVDVFDLSGTLLRRFASQGTLNAPWGLAIAPPNFGDFSNALLVGNFGDGRINAFSLSDGAFLGQMLEPSSGPLVIDGLWALTFGNGGQAGSPGILYFTAGIDDENHGLFGEIHPQHP